MRLANIDLDSAYAVNDYIMEGSCGGAIAIATGISGRLWLRGWHELRNIQANHVWFGVINCVEDGLYFGYNTEPYDHE
jgi:hypothetical protein